MPYALPRSLSIVGLLTVFCLEIQSQYLVSSQALGIRTEAELETQLGMDVRTGVTLYKITYMTTDVHGENDTASGLLVYPDVSLNNALPIVVYMHGTTNGPADAPSRMAA